MNDVLGLIDSLEATILESSKIPMTGKIVLDESKIIQLIDKLRNVVKNGDSVIKKAVDVSFDNQENSKRNQSPTIPILESSQVKPPSPDHIILDAKKEAEKIKKDAADYADYILANLQLMITKVQKNVINVEKNIDTSREMLERHKEYEETKFVNSEGEN